MFKFLTTIFNKTEAEKNYERLMNENEIFINSLNSYEVESLFEYLKPFLEITYSKTKKNNPLLNSFYNDFFSKYEKIIIQLENNIVINYNLLNDDIYIWDNRLIGIGYDNGDLLLVKKNGLKNGVFIETIDCNEDGGEESITKEDFLYNDIYVYIITYIGNNYDIVLKNKYEQMLQSRS